MKDWVRTLVWTGCVVAGTAAANSTPDRSISRMDIELLSDPIAPRASAFAPGLVAWVEPGGSWYQIVLQGSEGEGRRTVVDFAMPVMFGGGVGIAWLGSRAPSAQDELCIAVPDIRCAASPVSPTNTGSLQVGVIDGGPVVWITKSVGSWVLLQLAGERWQEIPLPDAIHRGVVSVLPAGDGFLLNSRDGLARWTHSSGTWAAEGLALEGPGHPVLSDTHLLTYQSGPIPRPSGQLFLHDDRPPGPGELHRIRLDGGGASTVQGDVGFLRQLVPHGEDGALIVGSHQAEYWLGDERVWRLPSNDMRGASWGGHPWVSIGSTRMRLDAAAIVVEDPVPGRFSWSERIVPELAACGSGHGLRWQHGETSWYAWMAGGHVQIGHACPGVVDPWPPGQIAECTEGTLLEVDDHVACVAVNTRQYVTRTSMVQLARRSP